MTHIRHRYGSRRQSGFGLSLTILILLGLSLVILATIILTDTSGRVANRGSLKVEATTLAEAGLHSFYDTIRTTMVGNNGTSYPLAPAATTLTSTINGTTRTMGTYSAGYVGAPTYTTSTNGATKTTTWNFTIQGVGTAAGSGTVSTVQTSFTATVVQTVGAVGLTGSIGVGLGAIQSATTINFKTDGGVRVYDVSGLNGANVIANGGIGWLPYNQTRAYSNSNLLYAQGDFMTLAAPSTAWAYTTSTTTGLYKSEGNTIFNSLSNGIVGMSSPAAFASSTQTTAWQSNWLTQSQSVGNTYNGNVNASNITPNPTNPGQGEHRITAPAYINGNLNVDNGQLYLQPNNNTTKPNVIYVTGNVTNAALLYNRGVDLVIQGQYLETSSSAQYQLQRRTASFHRCPLCIQMPA